MQTIILQHTIPIGDKYADNPPDLNQKSGGNLSNGV